jgi:adenine-specific DNA-methyltransferase
MTIFEFNDSGPTLTSLQDWKSGEMQDDIFYLGDNLDMLSSIEDESIDLVVTSPPYNLGKSYEAKIDFDSYMETQSKVIAECVRVLKPGGNIAWQVGFTIMGGELVPLDIAFYPVFKNHDLVLRNRIIWSFGHGLHAKHRFSGRHETIMWFSKGDVSPYFDLDSVRVPQLYPDKRHYKGPRKGEISGNPLGKNPGDVWDIPNVKAHHVEKTEHDCQFPIALAQRLIRALCPEGGTVLDPYAGVASTGCAAVIEGRNFVLAELDSNFHSLGLDRLTKAKSGELKFRDLGKEKQHPKSVVQSISLFEDEVATS